MLYEGGELMCRDSYIRVRCTSKQKEYAKKRAEAEGLTLTELVINLLLEEGSYYNEPQKKYKR